MRCNATITTEALTLKSISAAVDKIQIHSVVVHITDPLILDFYKSFVTIHNDVKNETSLFLLNVAKSQRVFPTSYHIDKELVFMYLPIYS